MANGILSKFKERLDNKFNKTDLKEIYDKGFNSKSSKDKIKLEDRFNREYNQKNIGSFLTQVAGVISGVQTPSNFISSVIGNNNIIGKALTNNTLSNALDKYTSNKIKLIPGGGFLGNNDQIKAELDLSTVLKSEIPPSSPKAWDFNNAHYIAPQPESKGPLGKIGLGEYAKKAAVDIGLTSGKSFLTELSNGKGINNLGLNNLFDTSVNSISKLFYARRGLKYTQAIGQFDNSSLEFSGWSNKIYYNKYLPRIHSNNQTYSDTINIKNIDTSNIINKYTGGAPVKDVVEGKWDIPEWSVIKNPNKDQTIEKKYGFPVYNGRSFNGKNIPSTLKEIPLGKDYDKNNRDFVKFKFEDLSSSDNNSKILIFRSTFTGLNDSVNADWNENKYSGRANKFYNYTGYSRNISFSFKVDAHNVDVLKMLTYKINKLIGMCYPADVDVSGNITTPPIIRLTIGDMYTKVIGKLNNVKVSPDDESLWETDDGMQIPHVFNIDVDFDIMQENTVIPTTNTWHIFANNRTYVKINNTINSNNNTSNNITTNEIPAPDNVAAKGI